MEAEKVYAMAFSRVYPLLVNKVCRKGRTEQEVLEVIEWLTGYDQSAIQQAIEEQWSYQAFFEQAPALNPNRQKITGVICGIRVENIQEPLMREIRYLDKLIDELAKGKKMEKILRQ